MWDFAQETLTAKLENNGQITGVCVGGGYTTSRSVICRNNRGQERKACFSSLRGLTQNESESYFILMIQLFPRTFTRLDIVFSCKCFDIVRYRRVIASFTYHLKFKLITDIIKNSETQQICSERCYIIWFCLQMN